jgi:conjugal transfer pilin signal peptidase TrbI
MAAMNPGMNKQRRRCLWQCAVGALLLLGINAAISLLLWRGLTPDIVMFDMQGTLNQFMDQSAQQKLTETEATQLSQRFSAALNESLQHYQATERALVLVSPAVVTGVSDITVLIQADIARRMRTGDVR